MKITARKLILLTLSLLMVILLFPAIVNAVSTEMGNRETVYYPSDKTGTQKPDVLNIPSGGEQDGDWSGNNLILSDGIAKSSFSISKTAINPAAKDYVWTFNYSAPSNALSGEGRDGGFAFTLHNAPTFLPEEDGDYGALGIYRVFKKNGDINNVGIKNRNRRV